MTKESKSRILKAKREYMLLNLPLTMRDHPSSGDHYDKTDKTASGLESCICDFMKYSGHEAESIKNQGRKVDKTEVVEDVLGRRKVIGSSHFISGSGTNGTPDVHAHLAPFGIGWKIEVKIGKDKLSDAQKKYLAKAKENGQFISVVSNMEQFFEEYDRVMIIMYERVKAFQIGIPGIESKSLF